MDEICVHGDVRELCIDCSVAPPKPQPNERPLGEFAFRAKFAGQCSLKACDDPIEVGQKIVKMTDDTYRHYGCVDFGSGWVK